MQAVEHGIETTAMKGAAAIQSGTVKALTAGLKVADGNLTVVNKAIAAPPPDDEDY